MTHFKQTAATLVALGMMSSPVWAEAGHAGHHHNESFSAGEPGNAKSPVRIVRITMGEKNGKMFYTPAKLEIKKGEQIKFVLYNSGELEHEFVLATMADNLKHAEAMKTNPGMEHDEPNGKELVAKATSEITWKFTKTGDFEYACLIPGHREAGMIGVITVK